ncbi:MAG: LPXTG cell wall anchor domain-containing protein [Ruminococcus sp.]|nr:LPXTG cell wall anchor domain-containing protein [Ruminococcus sp.]
MKKTKRFAAAAAAMALAVSMATVTAFAESPGGTTGGISAGTQVTPAGTTATTTVKANDAGVNHTFKAYPIFTGTIDGSKISNAAVGEVFTLAKIAAAAEADAGADLNTVLAKIETFDSDTALAFAKKLAKNITAQTAGTVITKEGVSLNSGYYLIVEDNKDGNNTNSLTANILKVVGGTELEVASKTDAPKLEKKVGEEKAELDAKYGNEGNYNYNDVADHSITEQVPFKLIGTMPSNLANYDHYMYKITDTYDDGLTIDPATIVVKIGDTIVYNAAEKDTTKKSHPTNADDYGLTVKTATTANGGTFVVNFVDIKAFGVTDKSVVTVEYKGCLNANAEIATDHEMNGAHLTYSRNFDSDVEWTAYDGSDNTEKPSPDKPNHPDTPNNSTEEKPNGDEETNNSNDSPEDKVILYTYELDIQKTDGQTAITGNAAKVAEFTVKQGDKYISVDTNNKVSGFGDTEVRINLDETGKLKIVGLDDGIYTITEVTPPTGYRLPEKASFTVEITGGIITKQDWNTFTPETAYDVTEQDITIDGDGAVNVKNPNKDEAGLYSADLVNAAIGSLPETGGIGTTMFYVGGGVLAAAAGTILIAKKRSKKEEQ